MHMVLLPATKLRESNTTAHVWAGCIRETESGGGGGGGGVWGARRPFRWQTARSTSYNNTVNSLMPPPFPWTIWTPFTLIGDGGFLPLRLQKKKRGRREYYVTFIILACSDAGTIFVVC